MDKATSAATATPTTCLGSDWFDRLEEAVRGQVRAFIEQLLEEELQAALGRGRYERARRPRDIATAIVTVEWPRRSGLLAPSELLPAYWRLNRRAELLIAQVYLAGVITRRVRRTLQTLFAGHVGKDAVSRAWRKTATAAMLVWTLLASGQITMRRVRRLADLRALPHRP